MKKRVIAIVAAFAAAAALVGGAVAIAGGNDSEGGAKGPQADQAVKAALDATGGGTANAVERDGEKGGTWEVEVTNPEGKVVDVRLDENFDVLMIEGDSESSDTGDGNG